jgi:hypothetical protein
MAVINHGNFIVYLVLFMGVFLKHNCLFGNFTLQSYGHLRCRAIFCCLKGGKDEKFNFRKRWKKLGLTKYNWPRVRSSLQKGFFLTIASRFFLWNVKILKKMLFASIFSPKTKEKTVFGFLCAVPGHTYSDSDRPQSSLK